MSYELDLNKEENAVGLGLFGGWFKRALQVVAGIVSAANPLIGATLFAAIEYADEHGWLDRNAFDLDDPRGLYQPTASENFIMNPQLKSIGETVADISLWLTSFTNEPNVLKKYDWANKINYRGDFLLWYYQNNELDGLSQQAIDSRAYLIEKALAPIYDKVSGTMAELGYFQTPATYVYPANAQIIDLYPKTINSFSREIKYPTWRFTNEKTVDPTIPTAPQDVEVITTPIQTTVELPEPTTLPTGGTTTTTTTPTTCVATETKFYQKWWFWVGVGYLARKIVK